MSQKNTYDNRYPITSSTHLIVEYLEYWV